MDQLKKFTTNELIILGGALAIFIGTFMKWFKVDISGLGGGSVNGFHYFFQGTIPWILAIVVAAAIIVPKLSPSTNVPDLPMPLSQLILIVSGVIAVLILTRIISVDGPSEVVDRGLGLFLAFAGGIAMAVGSFLKFQAKEDDSPGIGSGTPGGPPTPF